MAPYQPLSTLKLNTQTTTPAVIKKPTTPAPFDKAAYMKLHENTTDETGQVIQKNGKNVAGVNSPYNPQNIRDEKFEGSLAGGLNTIQNALGIGMGTPAKQPATPSQTNAVAPKYTASTANSASVGPTMSQQDFRTLMTNQGIIKPPEAPKPPEAANTTPTPTTTANPDDTSRSGLLSTLVSQSNTRNRELADRAQQIASGAGQTMSDIGQQGAKGVAGYRSTGTSPVGEGNAAILNQSTAAQQQAVAQGAQAELAGVGYGLTGQAQTQSALNAALGYQQPMSQFGVLVNPGDASPVGGGTAQSAAFAGGQTGASVGMGTQYQNNQAAQVGANNQVSSLTGIDISNPSNLPALNSLLQNWQNEGVSGPNAQKLRNTLNAINSAYSTILGYTVDVDTLSRSSGKTIGEVLQNLNDLANKKQEGLKNVGTGMGGVTTPSTTGGSTGGGLFDW